MNIAIWTDNDLDGAGSAFALKCLYGDKANIMIREVNDHEFTGVFKGWQEQNYYNTDLIFITDLFVPDDLLPYVDRGKVVVIDHHKSHVDVKSRYKVAKNIIEECSSCTNLILEKFKSGLKDKITPEQYALFRIIDDYDSYQLKFGETLKLNAVYHSFNKPKVSKFIDAFKDGLREFNTFEQNAIKLYFNRYKEQIDNAEFFTGDIKGFKVVSCCASAAINEVAHHALKQYNADIAIIVMPKTQSVSFRKNKSSCTIHLNKLAELLCNGGGHEYAAGGKITENFLNFTKTLTPCI